MKAYFFRLNLAYDECIHFYHASTPHALLMAESGERVQVPAYTLRPFIGHTGIQGRFRLLTDENNKIQSFERVG
ncbi:hypothetical protein HMF8227_01416 [Saliniradius amylolyticus]|uniref:DUF2835 domain-containing protein n=1 Tax=Saliniradius amylolyticus TaxID=2183582 RepID=A0A2S2E2M2_9ALTE|nr:DUF2835 family protein [Saliniradius amylolyticus]AWL11891.1 hypothetical protein HMF8227_01416 [Saliniradius amylolyticus]